jgi:hypothetical protein
MPDATVQSFIDTFMTAADEAAARAALGITSGGKILQVVQATKTDTASVTGQAFSSVFTGSITPSATTSRILIFGMLALGGNGQYPMIRLTRSATNVLQGDAAGSRIRVLTQTHPINNAMVNAVISVVDSPATTSAITYEIEIASQSSGTVYLNRSSADTDSANFARASSTLIFMEIGA